MKVVAFDNVRRLFGDRRVLDGLTLDVERGEVFGLLGPNGAGKTTAINILCGLLPADDGWVAVEGEAVTDQIRAGIGVVPQELSVYQDLTCRQNLRFFGRIFSVDSDSIDLRMEELTEAFGLGDYLDTRMLHLSGGWKRRLNMAVAMMHSPRLLILDEPTVGVDVEARYELWQLIQGLRSQDVTIVLTTHDLDEAEALCQRIGILSGGRLVAVGTVAELRAHVPGAQLLVLETELEDRARERAGELGWISREYGGTLSFLLPERMTIPEVVGLLGDLALTSLALKEVGLEHAYFEVTREDGRHRTGENQDSASS